MNNSSSLTAENNQTRKFYQLKNDHLNHLTKYKTFNRNRQAINIQDQFDLLSSYVNGETIDISLLEDTLKNICIYYTDLQVKKDFDIILKNQEICKSLIILISNPEENSIIRIYIIQIIYLFVSLNKDILTQLLEFKLFEIIKQIIEEDRVIKDLYIFISKTLSQILTYQDEYINELLSKSFLVASIIKD